MHYYKGPQTEANHHDKLFEKRKVGKAFENKENKTQAATEFFTSAAVRMWRSHFVKLRLLGNGNVNTKGNLLHNLLQNCYQFYIKLSL
jgi:hypothetical protein